MRRYETFIILDPDISEDQRSVVLQRTSDVIQQQDGFLAFIDEWGSRQLAYEIKKKTRGYYVRFDFCGTGAVVNEMERNYRIDDRVLKYMTVLTDDNPNLDSVKEEIAIAESEKAKAKEKAEEREKAAAQAKAEAEAKAVAAEAAAAEETAAAEAAAAKVAEAEAAKTEAADSEAADTEATEAKAAGAEKQAEAAEQAAAPEAEALKEEPVATDSEEEKK
jgi:small subunit ribosomal protein S6